MYRNPSLHIRPEYVWVTQSGVEMVRIITNAVDRSRDCSISMNDAYALFNSGALHYDASNRTFCKPGVFR